MTSTLEAERQIFGDVLYGTWNTQIQNSGEQNGDFSGIEEKRKWPSYGDWLQ